MLGIYQKKSKIRHYICKIHPFSGLKDKDKAVIDAKRKIQLADYI